MDAENTLGGNPNPEAIGQTGSGPNSEGGQGNKQLGQNPPPIQTQQAAAQKQEKLGPETGANVILMEGGEALAPGPLNMGMVPAIEIPSEEQQKAGFKVEKDLVGVLINQFRQFKHFVAKGQDIPTTG